MQYLADSHLAKVTSLPSKSLHRMPSPKGNPSMDNLAAIFDAVRKFLKVRLEAHTKRRQWKDIKQVQPNLCPIVQIETEESEYRDTIGDQEASRRVVPAMACGRSYLLFAHYRGDWRACLPLQRRFPSAHHAVRPTWPSLRRSGVMVSPCANTEKATTANVIATTAF